MINDDEDSSEHPPATGLYTGNHKKTALFHVLFKVLAVVLYLLTKYVLSDSAFVLCFIIIILLCAADFWVVKNVTGRVLVGLRWWNHVTADGESEWVFESIPDRTAVKAADSSFFWTVLFVYALLWLITIFLNLIALSWGWIPVCLIPFIMGATNAYGYAKCKKDWKKQGAAFAAQKARENPELAMQAVTIAAGSTTAAPPANGGATSSDAPPPSENVFEQGWGDFNQPSRDATAATTI